MTTTRAWMLSMNDCLYYSLDSVALCASVRSLNAGRLGTRVRIVKYAYAYASRERQWGCVSRVQVSS